MPSFKSFGAMADHFQRVINLMPTVVDAELGAVGREMVKGAKARLGDYQPSAGPFAAWAPLAPWTLATHARLGASMGAHPDSPLLVTGMMRESIAYKVTYMAVHVGSDDIKVQWQELGTPDAKHPIPPRSFLGATAYVQSPAHAKRMIARVGKLIVTGV